MDAVQQAVFRFDYPQALPSLRMPPAVCIGYTLLAIWRNHFSHIFQEIPFNPS
jgi:hypothetical protein